MPYGQGLTSKIIETGRPLLINQDLDKRRQELGATQIGNQARSYFGVPVLVAWQGDRCGQCAEHRTGKCIYRE